ncbi:hypothetical protein Tco_0944632, partial [Tanacetum coccineum]
LNTYSHDLFLGSKKIPSFDDPETQTQPFSSFPSLDVSLGEKRGPEPPIKPHSSDNFRMKKVDNFTIYTPPSPHVASLHTKDTYCNYHPRVNDPKKHYRFKPGLLGQSGSLGVDLSKLETIEDDWEFGFKEVSFLGRGLSLPVRPKEVENVRIKETYHSEHIIQQPNFQHVTPSHHNGQKEWDNPPNVISEQEVANLKAQAKRLFGNENVWVEMHRSIAWDKVENPDPESTAQVLPSFEECTPPVTYPEEVDETIGIPMKEIPNFEEPEPQP